MKLTLVLLFLGLFQASASVYSQQLRVSLKVKNTEIGTVLRQLEQQLNYSRRFVYNAEKFPLSKRVDLQVKNALVDEVLNRILSGTGFSHQHYGAELIVIVPQEVTVATPDKIRGKVTDERNEPLAGVSISIKSTTRGTITNSDGTFEIEASGEETLVASYIGYTSQELVPGKRQNLVVVLKATDQLLDAVVVVGYGARKKSDLTGAVGSVSERELQKRPVATLGQALSGRATGVNVSVNSGRPGGRTSIRIRGHSSLSNTNNPLYVVDGVILNVAELANGSSPLDYLDPGSIQSIEVLKDASSTAIYGARGANGVVLITSKKTKDSGGRVNYDVYSSISSLARKLDLLNSADFLRIEEVAYQNAAKYDPAGFASGKYVNPLSKRTNPNLFDSNGKPLYDTDWQNEATRTGIVKNHQLSFTKGSGDGDSYGVYLGYRDEKGIMKQSGLKRYIGRIVFDSKVKSWLRIDGNLSYNSQKDSQVDPIGEEGISPLRQVIEAIPIVPVRYADGAYGSNEDYPGMEGGGSYLEIVNNRAYDVTTQTVLGNVSAAVLLPKDLVFRSVLGVNQINQGEDYYAGRDLNFISRAQQGIASITNTRHNSWQFENYLTHDYRQDNEHAVSSLLGLSWQRVSRFNSLASSQGFLDDYYKYNNLGVGSSARPPSSSSSAYSLNSYFGRVNYSFRDRYLLTVTGRLDGSSKFGTKNKYAFFPSAALGWKVSDEPFMQAVQSVSGLKLRASYGVTGNSEIPVYRSLAGLGNYTYSFNQTRVIGVGVNRLANPDLRWEKNRQFDAGIEFGLFGDRIRFEADWYHKTSVDMLLDAPVPESSGYATIFRNIGSMQNKGVEFLVRSVNVETGTFSWATTFNISINQNKVTKLTGGADIISGAIIVREGQPVNSFYGNVRLGTWKSSEESEAARYNKRPGDVKFQDVNNDGAINQADRLIIGNGMPDGYGTFLNTITYKSLELTLDVQFMYGNDVMNMNVRSGEYRQGIANSLGTVRDAWRPDHQNTVIPEVRPIAAGYDNLIESRMVSDGSFIRGRNLQLAYRFPVSKGKITAFRSLRAYVTLENFFLLTKYTGYDPEVSTHVTQYGQGYVRADYPKARVFSIGLQVGL